MCPVDEAAGYTPCNLQNAYGLKAFSSKDGIGNTVAVVDPLDDPNAEADLKVFRKTYGLPACTTANGCFKKFNQNGVAGELSDSGRERRGRDRARHRDGVGDLSKCHIDLVEASSAGFGDLGTAENEAVALGAKVVSNSWGTGEFGGETGFDGDFEHPGVAITFSSGDGAYAGGVQYPSASPYVTSVGGTELHALDQHTRGWTETAWVTPGNNPPTQGSGSGCSAQEPKPPWQHDTGCAMRTTADVSAVAANVLSYNTYQSGGTWFYLVRHQRVLADHRRDLRPGEQSVEHHRARVGRVFRGREHTARHRLGQDGNVLARVSVQGGKGIRRSDRHGSAPRHRCVHRAGNAAAERHPASASRDRRRTRR